MGACEQVDCERIGLRSSCSSCSAATWCKRVCASVQVLHAVQQRRTDHCWRCRLIRRSASVVLPSVCDSSLLPLMELCSTSMRERARYAGRWRGVRHFCLGFIARFTVARGVLVGVGTKRTRSGGSGGLGKIVQVPRFRRSQRLLSPPACGSEQGGSSAKNVPIGRRAASGLPLRAADLGPTARVKCLQAAAAAGRGPSWKLQSLC